MAGPDAGGSGTAGRAGTEAAMGGSAGDASSTAGSGAAGACDGAFLPMAVGNSWTYRVTDPVDGASMKTTTVEDMAMVGGVGPNAGKQAFRVVTVKATGAMTDMTESWQDVLADGSVVRYREIGYKTGSTQPNGEDYWAPYKLRVDESAAHVVAGASWSEPYTETKIQNGVATPAARNDRWTVDAVDVPCGPVKGEMLSCIRLHKAADGAATSKTYLFARCVGKVREEGTQTEELIDYTVP